MRKSKWRKLNRKNVNADIKIKGTFLNIKKTSSLLRKNQHAVKLEEVYPIQFGNKSCIGTLKINFFVEEYAFSLVPHFICSSPI